MNKQTKEFYENMLQSVREMKDNRRAKETVIPISRILRQEARPRLNASTVRGSTRCFRANVARLGARPT